KEKIQVGEEAVPMFQLASMAQTRANAKVLRNVLSWVAVLAGYKPTPAEEIEDLTTKQPSKAQAVEAEVIGRKHGREPGDDEYPEGGPHISDEELEEALPLSGEPPRV